MMFAARLVVFLCFAFFLTAIVSGQQVKVSQPTIWSAKPDVAAFEKIENERLAASQRSVDTLLAVKVARTVENTLAPLDEAFHQINSAAYFAGLMEQVHPDAGFRDHATAMLTKASAAQTAIALNHEVYNALAAIDVSRADAATKYYVQRQLLEFRLAGVDKDDATRARLKKLNDQATEQQSMFDRNISDGQKTIEADPSELDGLPQDYIARHKPGANGKVTITTDYPDAFPVLTFAKSTDLRRRMSLAFNTRAFPKNEEVLTSLMKTRYEIATLLGYNSWADFNAADKMIAKGHNIADFIQQVNDASRDLSKREFEMLLTEKRKTDPNAKEIWDYEGGYLSEHQVRFRLSICPSLFPLHGSEARHPRYGRRALPRDLRAGTGCSLVGSRSRNLDCARRREADRTLLSRHASAPWQIQPRRNGAGARRHQRQAVA
jgi:thimet oligopeptidase